MEMQNVFDDKGVWFTNTGEYPFVDPTNGCRFEPKVRTKTVKTPWLAQQATVIKPEIVEAKAAPAKPSA